MIDVLAPGRGCSSDVTVCAQLCRPSGSLTTTPPGDQSVHFAA
jgi:hypothetical protein